MLYAKKIGACRTSLEEVFKNSEPKQALCISYFQNPKND
jgi:hypothetical protein